jgi:hypothetical protein
MATRITYSKTNTEDIQLQSSMIDRLLSGETIASVTSDIFVWSGVDAAPSAVLSGSPTHNNGVIFQDVVGGEVGVIYKILLSATTSLSNLYINELKLAVLNTMPEDE